MRALVRRVKNRIRKLITPSHQSRPVEVRYVAGLVRLYDEVLDVPGHVIEIGTGSGRNALIFGELIMASGQSDFRRYYGFDTFRGYTTEDIESSPHLDPSAHIYSKVETEGRIRDAGLTDLCCLYEGDAPETLSKFVQSPPPGVKFQPLKLRVSLLYIDCNAYRATRRALEVLGPFLSPGAIVAIDETIQGGETQALEEWCEQEGYDIQAGRFGSVISAFTRLPKSRF